MATSSKPRDAKKMISGARTLLGVISDEELAARLGVAPTAVANYRRAEGIKAAPKSARLSEAELPKVRVSKVAAHHDLVGTVSDTEVSRAAGVSSQAVQAYRKRHDIQSFQARAAKPDEVHQDSAAAPETAPEVERPKTTRWRRPSKVEAFHNLVGTVPDAKVARKAGVSTQTVAAYRRRHRIPDFDGEAVEGDVESRPAQSAVSTEAEAAPPEAAAATTTPEPPGDAEVEPPESGEPVDKMPPKRRLSKIGAYHDLVGTVSDAVVAQKARVKVQSVQAYRARHGIPAHVPSAPAVKAQMKTKRFRKSKIDPVAKLVGTVPDSEIAELAGVTVSGVKWYRRQRQIPAFKPPTPAEAAVVVEQAQCEERAALAPAAGAAGAPPHEETLHVVREPQVAPEAPQAVAQVVWRVLGVEERVYVVAPTMAEAATKAEAAGFSVGLKRIGRAV